MRAVIGQVADPAEVTAAGYDTIYALAAMADEAVALVIAMVATWCSTYRTPNLPKEPKGDRVSPGMLNTIALPLVGVLFLLGACADGPGGGENTGLLDRIAETRCSEAKETIGRLRDTADLYSADELEVRFARMTRLAEIWCPDFEPEPLLPAPAQEPPPGSEVPSVGGSAAR